MGRGWLKVSVGPGHWFFLLKGSLQKLRSARVSSHADPVTMMHLAGLQMRRQSACWGLEQGDGPANQGHVWGGNPELGLGGLGFVMPWGQHSGGEEWVVPNSGGRAGGDGGASAPGRLGWGWKQWGECKGGSRTLHGDQGARPPQGNQGQSGQRGGVPKT